MSVRKIVDMQPFFGMEAPCAARLVKAGNFYFLSGQPGIDVDRGIGQGDIIFQTKAALDNTKTCLQTVGLNISDIVKMTVHLADAREFALMNAVMREEFGLLPPARVTVVASMLIDIKIELEVIAYKEE